jgi:hypothetical protein
MGAAFGSPARLFAGIYTSVPQACEATIHLTGKVQPSPARTVYQDFYPRYRALYPALASEFSAMAGVVSQNLGMGKTQ